MLVYYLFTIYLFVIEKTTCINNFPLVHKTLLKFGCKVATSALYVYSSLKTVQEQAQCTRSIKLRCH